MLRKTVLDPAACRALVPELATSRNPDAWVYRYEHPEGWRLSIATHAPPGSDRLSLGGFRIAPEERTSLPGFDSDVEAIGLAMGMEEKVHWSRIVRVGGPLAQRDMGRIVGGKCVLVPTPEARVGAPRDRDLLDFAIASLRDCDKSAGIRITTGQDLGHGLMSDRRTSSLDYLNRGFPGSVVADTSKPTAEGNYYVLRGMLRAFGIGLDAASVGLLGVGNIGAHIAERLRDAGATTLALDPNPQRRAVASRLGARAFDPAQKSGFLAQPIDALVVNGAGGSLDTASVECVQRNQSIRAVCGSENLVMPDPDDAEKLRVARKAYCPTEFGGMMGYLTAVEQYLSSLEGTPFRAESMMEAARGLEEPAFAATRHMIDNEFATDFQAAVEAISAGTRTA